MSRKVLDVLRRERRRLAVAATLAAVAAASAPASALVEGKDEKDNLRACERQLCEIFLKKSLKGDDLQCRIVKTWAKSTIKNGVDKKISWTSGDARCEMDLHLSRAELVAAVSAPQHRFMFKPHLIRCAIEEDKDVKSIRVLLAPEVEFKNGIAVGGKVHVKKIDAPFLFKTGIWTAATLIDKVGLFQKELTKEINKLSQKRCPEVYGEKAVAAKKTGAAKRALAKKPAGEKHADTKDKDTAHEGERTAKADTRQGGKSEGKAPGVTQAGAAAAAPARKPAGTPSEPTEATAKRE